MRKTEDRSVASQMKAICETMRSHQIQRPSSADYYAVENSFIRFARQGHGSPPIPLAVIFVAIARRCGIRVARINYVSSNR